MIFNIRSHENCGPIGFGDRRETVRSVFEGEQPQVLKRNEFAVNSMDVFYGEVFVMYDADDRCHAVEICNGKQDVVLGNLHLFSLSYAELKKQIQAIDAEIEEDETGFTSRLYGAGVYAPDKDEDPDGPIETVIVFKPGYYDKE